MKGDLHTLKKVCSYGSKTMLAGTVILLVLAVALSIIWICSLTTDWAKDLLDSILSNNSEFGSLIRCSMFFELLFFLLLAAVSVYITFLVMRSVATEHSPFNESNTKLVITLSQIYFGSAFVFAILEILGDIEISSILFMFFGCVFVSVILYVLALIIRYGAVLQNESDHTL